MEKVSVLLTTYNYGRFVVQSVESVLNQDYGGEIELIVVDDGSTDNTSELLAPYEGRIIYIKRENGGQNAAFNTGFARSTGAYIHFLDADDWWKPEKVRRTQECFDANPDAGLVHFRLLLVGEEGGLADHKGRPSTVPVSLTIGEKPAHGEIRRVLLDRDFPWLFAPGKAFRRSAVERLMPLPTPEGMTSFTDSFLINGIAMFAPVAYLDEVLGFYRMHSANHHFGTAERKRAWAAMRLLYFETLYAFVEKVLAREKTPLSLHVEGSWRQQKLRSAAEHRAPLRLLPHALAELWKRRHFTLSRRIADSSEMLFKSVERTLKGKY